MREVQPHEARQCPELPEEITPAMRDLLTAVNGFPYPGDGTNALVFGVRWLRAHPDKAAELGIGTESPR